MTLCLYWGAGSLPRLGVFAGVALLRAFFRSTGVGIVIGCSFDYFYIFPYGHFCLLPSQSDAEQDAPCEQNDCVECDDCVCL